VNIVTTQRGGFVIRIYSGRVGRGEPLYVIDGAPLFVDPRRGIVWLRPDDIATIEVLKGPAETAIYGPRGVNGVIVITTKRR
jgi:TonB-dependent SusC/RagA subfamily outer membrane receptor